VYALYSVLIVTFFLVMSPYLAWQAVRYRKSIGSLRQRLGYLPLSFNLDGEQSIWIHAVSVGEVLTARALLPQLRERYPRYRLFLSTTTMTGQAAHNKGIALFPRKIDGKFVALGRHDNVATPASNTNTTVEAQASTKRRTRSSKCVIGPTNIARSAGVPGARSPASCRRAEMPGSTD